MERVCLVDVWVSSKYESDQLRIPFLCVLAVLWPASAPFLSCHKSEDEGTGYIRAGKLGKIKKIDSPRVLNQQPSCLPLAHKTFNWTCIRRVEKMSQDQAEQNIQMWKVKKLIKSLDSARG